MGKSRECITVYKVKAHLGEEAIAQGRISWHDWAGNGEADRLAVMGAETATRLSPNANCDEQFKKAAAFYNWVAQFTNAWPDDTARDGGEEERGGESQAGEEEEKGARGSLRVHPVNPHAWWFIEEAGTGGRHECRRCGKSVGASSGAQGVFWQACKGSMAGRLKNDVGRE